MSSATTRQPIGATPRSAGGFLGPQVAPAGIGGAHPPGMRSDFAHHGAVDERPWGAARRKGEQSNVWENSRSMDAARDEIPRSAGGGSYGVLQARKYGSLVRVVDIPGVSLELCGGTHVSATRHYRAVRFTHETGATPVTPIEAVGRGPVAVRAGRKLGGQLDSKAAGSEEAA